MAENKYHNDIIEYYRLTENAYKDSWDLNNSLAIHYGYWDEKVRSFPQSLMRMNEVMMEAAQIKPTDIVLDAGCGVGGSSIFLAQQVGCKITGITLSERQAGQATLNARKIEVETLVDFKVMDYCNTTFANESFDIVWGCESICYADNKEKFVKEAYRLLKPGGRLVITDGFVTEFKNNDHPYIRNWLDGWQVNYLESPDRFLQFIKQAGFANGEYKDISKYTSSSSRRLYMFFYLANLYLAWKKLTFSNTATVMQKKNINACKYQYHAAKKKLWQYGLVTAIKP